VVETRVERDGEEEIKKGIMDAVIQVRGC